MMLPEQNLPGAVPATSAPRQNPDRSPIARPPGSIADRREWPAYGLRQVRQTGGDMVPWQVKESRQERDILMEKNEKLNLLFSVTRHDIGNQLAALQLYLDLARQKPADDNQREYLRRMTSGIDQISSILRFTREYQEIGMQAPAWHDLNLLVQAASEPFFDSPVTIATEIPQVRIYADPLIERVFYNIIDNAIQHGGAVTRLSITARCEGTSLAIVCEDNGTGIPADEKERIFWKGYGKHSGFGLFLVREILRITGIAIMETGTYGKGAQFRILVPPGMFRAHHPAGDTGLMIPARTIQPHTGLLHE